LSSLDDILGKMRFTIYQMDAAENLTRSRVDRFIDISNTLVAAGAERHEISRLNLSTHADADLAEYINSKMNGVINARPPYVFYYSHYLGDGETVQRMFQTGSLQQLISGKINEEEKYSLPEQKPKEEDTKPQLRLIDNLLDVTESISSYLNPFSWWRSPDPVVIDQDPILSVDVIHTNWYGRNLRRTFKFYSTYFQRVHPNGHVRATYDYTQVLSINRKDQGIIVIEYPQGISPDWIQASVIDITRITALIVEKNSSIKTHSLLATGN